jgi:hypothetical protein
MRVPLQCPPKGGGRAGAPCGARKKAGLSLVSVPMGAYMHMYMPMHAKGRALCAAMCDMRCDVRCEL